MMARERPQVLQRVDEKLFETLNLPESTRVAIRQINDDHKRQAQAALTGGALGGPDSLDAAENSRRKAIDTLLAPDDAKKFHAQEFAITRQLRRQAREPQPTAPSPPAPPPTTE